ncbi:MAG: kynurenine 3-monooxygenase [Cyclobacteriaceae bacterium]|nr:MAG: kynurenine 3-monooxygenase [Cyclobacteriaceae bacterium]
MKKESIVVLGAGLVGSLMATYLARRQYQVQMFEKRPDIRSSENDSGRSINLALSHRGLKALNQVGLLSEISKICLPMRGRMMHDVKGALTFQPYGKEGQFINSVSRNHLNTILMNAAETSGVRMHFQEECLAAEPDHSITHLAGPQGTHQVRSDYILGADGAYSGLREALRKTDRFDFSQYYLPHGYKELTITPSAGKFALDPEALHIWPREQYMLIALPNLDKSFTCTLFLPFEGACSFENLVTEKQVSDLFEQSFGDVVEFMPDLLNEFFEHPTSSMVTIRCAPWIKGKACLVGDASHAIVPFYGQGMNAGFEDCRLLDAALDEYQDDFLKAFGAFQKKRIPDANAIAELALQNFIEMRDLVADEEFLLRKKIERRLNKLYPDQWVPLYSRVTFSDERYSNAQRLGKVQRSIMDKVMREPNIHSDWETMDLSGIIGDLKKQADLT